MASYFVPLTTNDKKDTSEKKFLNSYFVPPLFEVSKEHPGEDFNRIKTKGICTTRLYFST